MGYAVDAWWIGGAYALTWTSKNDHLHKQPKQPKLTHMHRGQIGKCRKKRQITNSAAIPGAFVMMWLWMKRNAFAHDHKLSFHAINVDGLFSWKLTRLIKHF